MGGGRGAGVTRGGWPRERGVSLGRMARARRAGGRARAGPGVGLESPGPAAPLGLQGRPPGAVGGPPGGGLSRGSVNGAAGGTRLRLMRARWAAPRLPAAPPALISTEGLCVPRTSAPCPALSRPSHPRPSKPLSALAPGKTGARPGAWQARLSVLHPPTVPQNPHTPRAGGYPRPCSGPLLSALGSSRHRPRGTARQPSGPRAPRGPCRRRRGSPGAQAAPPNSP